MKEETKDIRIAIPCPWGPTLRFIELKDWEDCDVHQWLFNDPSCGKNF